MKLSDMALCIYYPLLSPSQKASVARRLERERNIMRVMSILPGGNTYKQVEAAIQASNTDPVVIYNCLSSNEFTVALVKFLAALAKEVCK